MCGQLVEPLSVVAHEGRSDDAFLLPSSHLAFSAVVCDVDDDVIDDVTHDWSRVEVISRSR